MTLTDPPSFKFPWVPPCDAGSFDRGKIDGKLFRAGSLVETDGKSFCAGQSIALVQSGSEVLLELKEEKKVGEWERWLLELSDLKEGLFSVSLLGLVNFASFSSKLSTIEKFGDLGGVF